MQAKPRPREPETLGDLIGIRPAAALAMPERCHVVMPAVHGLEQVDHTRRAIGEFISQPLAEHVFDFKRHAQKHIAGVARTRVTRGLQDRLDLVIGQPGHDRRDHDGDGNAGLA